MKYYDEKHNKFFNTEKEYNEYQEKIAQEEKQKEDLRKTKKARAEEVVAAYNKFADLWKKYDKDYQEYVSITTTDYRLDSSWRTMFT